MVAIQELEPMLSAIKWKIELQSISRGPVYTSGQTTMMRVPDVWPIQEIAVSCRSEQCQWFRNATPLGRPVVLRNFQVVDSKGVVSLASSSTCDVQNIATGAGSAHSMPFPSHCVLQSRLNDLKTTDLWGEILALDIRSSVVSGRRLGLVQLGNERQCTVVIERWDDAAEPFPSKGDRVLVRNVIQYEGTFFSTHFTSVSKAQFTGWSDWSDVPTAPTTSIAQVIPALKLAKITSDCCVSDNVGIDDASFLIRASMVWTSAVGNQRDLLAFSFERWGKHQPKLKIKLRPNGRHKDDIDVMAWGQLAGDLTGNALQNVHTLTALDFDEGTLRFMYTPKTWIVKAFMHPLSECSVRYLVDVVD
jgi:hypothetical protein